MTSTTSSTTTNMDRLAQAVPEIPRELLDRYAATNLEATQLSLLLILQYLRVIGTLDDLRWQHATSLVTDDRSLLRKVHQATVSLLGTEFDQRFVKSALTPDPAAASSPGDLRHSYLFGEFCAPRHVLVTIHTSDEV